MAPLVHVKLKKQAMCANTKPGRNPECRII